MRAYDEIPTDVLIRDCNAAACQIADAVIAGHKLPARFVDEYRAKRAEYKRRFKASLEK